MDSKTVKALIYTGVAVLTLIGNLAGAGALPGIPGIPPVDMAFIDTVIATGAAAFVHAYNHPDAPAPAAPVAPPAPPTVIGS